MRSHANSSIPVSFDARSIDQIFSHLDRCHLPGAAVGVALGGEVVYRRGFGLANMELPIALSPGIRMRIGSVTKHFASLAYLLLCEEGKATVDDPIGVYLPEVHPSARAITCRQLMGQVSGLRDAHDIRWHFSGTAQPVSSDELFALYRDIEDVNAAAGSAWIYNNGGYLLLSVAIERITGHTLEEVLAQRIFEPLGMFDTRLRRLDTDFLRNSATLHMTGRSGGYEKSHLGTALAGEGGIVSTVDDMLRWLAHMDRPVVGTAQTWGEIKAPQTLGNGTSTGYGLGLRPRRYRGLETFTHAGGVMGGHAQMLKVPEAGLDLIILANRHDVNPIELADRILDACLPNLPASAATSEYSPGSGVFRSAASDRVLQLFVQEGKQIVCLDGLDMEVMADNQGVLRPSGMFSHLQREIVRTGDPEKPSSVRLTDFGNVDELVRVPIHQDSDASAVVGRYRADRIGIDVTITGDHTALQLHTVGRFGSAAYSLTPLGEGIYRARSQSSMPWSGMVSFSEAFKSLYFTTSRTYQLPFRRRA